MLITITSEQKAKLDNEGCLVITYLVQDQQQQADIEKHLYILKLEDHYLYSDTQLGVGAFGVVCKAHQVSIIESDDNIFHINSINDPLFNQPHHICVKLFRRWLEDIEPIQRECNFLNNYFRDVKGPIKLEMCADDENAFSYLLTMEYFDAYCLVESVIEGREIVDKPHASLISLNFAERIKALLDIAHFINLFHNGTGQIEQSIVHRDLHPGNVLLGKNAKGTFAVLVDLGFAVNVESDNLEEVESIDGCNLAYGPEIKKKKVGKKSDVYSFAGICAFVLGAYDVYDDKKVPSNSWKNFIFDSLLRDELLLPEIIRSLKPYIIKFIERMAAENYEDRPYILEVLSFLNTIHQLCLLSREPVLHKEYGAEINYKQTKVVLLAEGCLDRVEEVLGTHSGCSSHHTSNTTRLLSNTYSSLIKDITTALRGNNHSRIDQLIDKALFSALTASDCSMPMYAQSIRSVAMNSAPNRAPIKVGRIIGSQQELPKVTYSEVDLTMYVFQKLSS